MTKTKNASDSTRSHVSGLRILTPAEIKAAAGGGGRHVRQGVLG